MIAVTALLCGAENFTHMAQFGKAKESWLRTFLTLANGIPSHDTFRRVFMLLSPEKFSSVFLSWTQSLRQAVGAEVVDCMVGVVVLLMEGVVEDLLREILYIHFHQKMTILQIIAIHIWIIIPV